MEGLEQELRMAMGESLGLDQGLKMRFQPLNVCLDVQINR